MTQDMTYFEAHPEEYAELSHEDQAKLFEGWSIEGENTSESPDAETTVETQQPEAEPAEQDPVLLAKDGQHTIPYEELLSARDLARHYEQIARDQAAVIESLKASNAAPEADQRPAMEAASLDDLWREHAEAEVLNETDRANEIRAKIQSAISAQETERTRSMVTQEFAQRDAAAAAEAAQASLDATVAKVIEAYPFLDSTKPTANADAISDVVTWRDALVAKGTPMHIALAQAAAKFAPLYSPPKPATAASVAEQAAEAIASAKAKPPASMSSIPSSASPPTDELQSITGLSVQAMQDRMRSMPPDKIMALINRTVVV